MDPPASVDGLLLDENWISTTSGGSLATEVGLLHHPEATHLLFHVIEDVTPWSVGQFPIMFSYLRGPPRYLLKDEMVEAKLLSNLENMRMPLRPNDVLPHRS